MLQFAHCARPNRDLAIPKNQRKRTKEIGNLAKNNSMQCVIISDIRMYKSCFPPFVHMQRKGNLVKEQCSVLVRVFRGRVPGQIFLLKFSILNQKLVQPSKPKFTIWTGVRHPFQQSPCLHMHLCYVIVSQLHLVKSNKLFSQS